MIRSSLLAIGLSLAFLAPSSNASDPGTAYCFGVGCPCGNDDATGGGCVNSSGSGALLTATGTASVAAEDLNFHGTRMPVSAVTIVITAPDQQALPFKDGKLCVAGQLTRLFKHNNTGQTGTIDFQDVLASFKLNAQPKLFAAGEVANFQLWFRDAPGSVSPCGGKSNLTNGYQITFTP
jgi:hypothetical protein